MPFSVCGEAYFTVVVMYFLVGVKTGHLRYYNRLVLHLFNPKSVMAGFDFSFSCLIAA